MDCTDFVWKYIGIYTLFCGILFTALTIAISSPKSYSTHITALPVYSCLMMFISTILNFVAYNTDDSYTEYSVGIISWLTDCLSRLLLLAFAAIRIRNLVNQKMILYIIIVLTTVIILSTFSIMMYMYYYIQKNILVPDPIYVTFYMLSDIPVLCLDVYLGYLVSMAYKSKNQSWIKQILFGHGSAILASSAVSVVSIIILLYNLDVAYFFYTILIGVRILLVEVFNKSLMKVMMSKTRNSVLKKR